MKGKLSELAKIANKMKEKLDIDEGKGKEVAKEDVEPEPDPLI